MNTTTQPCPGCARDIPLAITVCPFCGARFRLTYQGYCPACHHMRQTDEAGRCASCGAQAIDWRLERELLSKPPPAPAFEAFPMPVARPSAPAPETLEILPVKGEGVSTRWSAVILDSWLIGLIYAALAAGYLLLTGSGMGRLSEREMNELISRATAGTLALLPAIWFFYFFVLEWAFGATPGKAACWLRVIRKDGGRIAGWQAAVRALLSFLEYNPLGAIVIWSTPLRQRIGDLLASTLVVQKHKPRRAEFKPPALAFEFHDSRRVEFARLTEGVLYKFGLVRQLQLTGESPDGSPLRLTLQGHLFRQEFDMLRLNLERRYKLHFPERLILWRLAVVVFAVLALLCGMAFALQAGGAITLPALLNLPRAERSPTSIVAARVTSTRRPTATTRPTHTTRPTRTPIPTRTPTPTVVLNPGANPGLACVLTRGGMTCLDGQGWFAFPRNDPSLQDDRPKAAICADGTFAFNYGNQMLFYDGQHVLTMKESGRSYSGEFECNSAKQIWVAASKELSHYDGKAWHSFPFSDLPAEMANEDSSNPVQDLALAPTGQLYVIQTKTVSSYDGTSWSVLRQEERFFGAALDSQGKLWVSYSKGLLEYQEGAWKEHAYSRATFNGGPVLDASGRVWLGSSAGLLSYDAKAGWAARKIEAKTPIGKRAYGLAIDAAGRIWVGTEYGLAVFDGKTWQTYHMHTSNLGSNYIEEIRVFGAPELPELQSKPNGSLSGQVTSKSGASTAGLPVEICVNSFGLFYTGSTPCSSQPFHLSTTTDKEGNFTFPDLPMGVYYITFRFGGQWKYMTAGLGFVAQSYRVEAGEDTRIKDLVVD